MIENLKLIGALATNGTGNTLDNRMTGNMAANALSGLDGSDTLAGGLRLDQLKGGGEADRFVFDALQGTAVRDKIMDFTHDSDKIAFDRAVFAAFAGDDAGALGPAAFKVEGMASNSSQHLLYTNVTGKLFMMPMGVAAILVALLVGASGRGWPLQPRHCRDGFASRAHL